MDSNGIWEKSRRIELLVRQHFQGSLVYRVGQKVCVSPSKDQFLVIDGNTNIADIHSRSLLATTERLKLDYDKQEKVELFINEIYKQ